MFCIQQTNCTDYPVKTHYISNKEVAEEVLRDLSARFNGVEMIEIDDTPDKSITWDPGGMLMMNDTEFNFNLGDISVKCKAQHLSYLAIYLSRYLPRGDKTKYFKIHGHYICICITPEEFEKLNALVNDPSRMEEAKNAEEERERRIQSVVDSGHLIRAAKDAAGNIIDLDKLAKKNIKDLN